MSITNKGTLRTAVLAELVWDTSLDTRVDEWTDRLTASLNRDLRVKDMLTTATGTLTAGTATLAQPSDFLSVESFYITTGGESIMQTFVTPTALEQTVASDSSGQPTHIAVIGSNFKLKPIPDSAYNYTLLYYQNVPVLTTDTDTNWVLTNHPDAYLYGVLVFGGIYLNDSRVQEWSTLFTRALQGIRGESDRAMLPPGNLQVTLEATVT